MIPDLVKLTKALLGIPELGINFGLGMFFAGASAPFSGLQQGMGIFGSIQSIAHLPFLHGKLGPLNAIAGPTQQEMQIRAMEQFYGKERAAQSGHKPTGGGGQGGHGGRP